MSKNKTPTQTDQITTLTKSIKHLEETIIRSMVAAQELTLAYEDIGSALIEIATANMKSNEGKIEAAQISLAALDQDDVPAAQESFLLELANNFRSHIREVHEGNPFQAYNTAIAKDVLDGFRPVKERIDVTLASIRSVEQMARSVAKSKNNPQKRREASPDSAASESDSAFEKLVQINNHTTAQNLHRYLYLNHTYIQELLCRLTGLSEKFSFVLSGAYQLMCEESHARGAVVVEESAARASQWSAHISAVLRGPQVQMANEEASQRAQIRRKEERQMADLLDSAARGYFNLRGDELIQDESAARRSVEEEEKRERRDSLHATWVAVLASAVFEKEAADRMCIASEEATQRNGLQGKMTETMDIALNDEELESLELASTFYGKEYQELMRGAVGPQRTVTVSPFIGFSLTDNVKKGHLIVDGIFEKGPAYQVGVDVDHELVAIHDEKVSSIEHVRRLIGKYCFPGRVTRFTLRDAHGCLYNPMVWVMTADDRFSDKKYFFDVALHPKKESSRIKREWRPTE